MYISNHVTEFIERDDRVVVSAAGHPKRESFACADAFKNGGVEYPPSCDDLLSEGSLQHFEIQGDLKIVHAVEQMKVFGHDNPCDNLDAHDGADGHQVLGEVILDEVIGKELESMVARAREKAGLARARPLACSVDVSPFVRLHAEK